MADHEELRSEFTDLFLADDPDAAIARSKETLESGWAPLDFFQKIFSPAMEAVGDKFGRLEIFLPELMAAAESAKAVTEQVLHPILQEKQAGASVTRGRVLLGSVRGDLHDIGKNMVGLMLEVNGFEVIDLGIDVDSRDFIDRALEVEADIVGLSSLMTTSMPYMKEVVEMRDGFGHKDKFSIIVGGAPITPKYSEEIGADALGEDAVDAVQKCIELMEARSKDQ